MKKEQIIIKNPSAKMLQLVEKLRENKQNKLNKLRSMEECTFTLTV